MAVKTVLVALLLSCWVGPAARAADPQWVRITTSMGDFVIEVDSNRAPLTATNFLRYVKEGHYNGTLIHRVVSNFVIQGGGFTPDGRLKPVHEAVPNEAGNGLRNLRATVGLARTADPHSGNSQFYVNIADNPDLDPVPTRWGYAVFGKVVQGMDVIDRIGVVPTGAVPPFKSEAPLTPVIIQKVELTSPPSREPVPSTPPSDAPPQPPAPTRAQQ